MDITVKIDPRNKSGMRFSKTFIGDKKDILPYIQRYIQEHGHLEIEVTSQDENPDVTHAELFLDLPKVEDPGQPYNDKYVLDKRDEASEEEIDSIIKHE